MRQIFQNLESGETEIVEAPAPALRAGHILTHTTTSLISLGTERMLVEFARGGLLSKVRQQPDKVKQVLAKARTDGIVATLGAVRSKLGQPLPLGYCNVGVVLESATGEFAPGDRVVSNGPHADLVLVPRNLAARIPESVSDEAASFTVVASIALQGIRLAQPTLGEVFVVTGVGLIGLLAVQILRANGCQVLAVDFDDDKLALARQFGAEVCNPGRGEDPVAAGLAISRGRGVDGVILTASTKSSDPVSQAANMCRKRGRIVLVGVTGLDLQRADFYEKELSFQVSCSYGPGRYDPDYEERGNDYPLGFVRWTEQRNFEAVLDLMASGAIATGPLVSHRFPFLDAPQAYGVVGGESARALGIVLEYYHPAPERTTRHVALAGPSSGAPAQKQWVGGAPRLAVIGAGNYASRVLIPSLRKAGAQLATIASSGGSSAVIHGRKAGFAAATTDVPSVFADPAIDAVVIATRHDSHARLALDGLASDKSVFVEKPLALTHSDVDAIEAALASSAGSLTVGFNRRFAPHTVAMKRALDSVSEPKVFLSLMNAGAIPASHWTQDSALGGGRIVGEACHHIDLLRYLAGSPIVSITATSIGQTKDGGPADDKAAITIHFLDGSLGTVHYLANGDAGFPKERIEAFAAGRIVQLDNFVRLRAWGWPKLDNNRLFRQDKGQAGLAESFVDHLANGAPPPIPSQELFEVARAAIEAAGQLRRD